LFSEPLVVQKVGEVEQQRRCQGDAHQEHCPDGTGARRPLRQESRWRNGNPETGLVGAGLQVAGSALRSNTKAGRALTATRDVDVPAET
jgi:hypothetical protein